MRDTGSVANGGTGILTSSTDEVAPEVARRTWPRWVALAIAMLAVAVTAVLWDEAGARLLLGAIGAFLVGRGVVLLRGARAADAPAERAVRARGLGTTAAALGAGALVFALVSEAAAATALLVAVPLLLLGAGVALLGGAARRGGQAVLVWAVLVTGLLVATGIGRDWERAADVATVIAAVAVAVLAVPVLVGASSLRVAAARPAPAPARTLSSACAGCACGAGGCGA